MALRKCIECTEELYSEIRGRRSVEKEDIISENSVRLCQEGIEKMHRMH
jgi:hypothetical protein